MTTAVEAAPPRPRCWICGSEAEHAAEYAGTSLHACRVCGFVFLPGARAEDLDSLYGDDYFARYGGAPYSSDERGREQEAEVRIRFVQRRSRSGRLLEIGCAHGFFVAAARRAGFDVAGVEISPTAAEEARKRAGVPVQVARIEDADLAPAAYDVVCAWHVLEHLAHPLPVVERLRHTLAPGGHLFLEVPNRGSVRATREGAAWRPLDLEHHVGQYDPRALAELLERAGYELVETQTVPFAVYRRGLSGILAHGKAAAIARTVPGRPHPWKHELLRAVARVPA